MRSDRHRRAATAAVAALAALTFAAGCSSIHTAQHSGAVTGPSSARTPPPFAPPQSSPSSAAPAVARVSSEDRSWLNEIHQANLAEAEAGTLAAKKASSGAVRSAGDMMASQHTAFDEKIVEAAARLHVTLPDYLTPGDAEAADRLGSETGSVYDHDFTSTMMTSHEKVISDTQDEISHGSSPVVTDLARQALPMLRMHLAALQSAAAAP